jgi:hypothetical protein
MPYLSSPARFRDPAGNSAGNFIPAGTHGSRIAGAQQENTQEEPDNRESE